MFLQSGKTRKIRNVFPKQFQGTGRDVYLGSSKSGLVPIFKNTLQTEYPFQLTSELNIPYRASCCQVVAGLNYIATNLNYGDSQSMMISKYSAKNQTISWVTAVDCCNTPIVGFTKYNNIPAMKHNSRFIQFYMYVKNGKVIYCQNGADAVSLSDFLGKAALDASTSHMLELVMYLDTVSFYVDGDLWIQSRVPAQGYYYACASSLDLSQDLISAYAGATMLFEYKHTIFSPFPMAIESVLGEFANDFAGNKNLQCEATDGTSVNVLSGNGNNLAITQSNSVALSMYEGQYMRYNSLCTLRPFKYASYNFTYKKLVNKYGKTGAQFVVASSTGNILFTGTICQDASYQNTTDEHLSLYLTDTPFIIATPVTYTTLSTETKTTSLSDYSNLAYNTNATEVSNTSSCILVKKGEYSDYKQSLPSGDLSVLESNVNSAIAKYTATCTDLQNDDLTEMNQRNSVKSSYNNVSTYNNVSLYEQNTVNIYRKINISKENTISICILPQAEVGLDAVKTNKMRAIISIDGENCYTFAFQDAGIPHLEFDTYEGSILADMSYQPIFDSATDASYVNQVNSFDAYTYDSSNSRMKEPYKYYDASYDAIKRIANDASVDNGSNITLNFFNKLVPRKAYKNFIVTVFVPEMVSIDDSQITISFSPSFFTEQHPLGNVFMCQDDDIQPLMVEYLIGKTTEGKYALVRVTGSEASQFTVSESLKIQDRIDIMVLKNSQSTSSTVPGFTYLVYANGCLLDIYTTNNHTTRSSSLLFGVNLLKTDDYISGLRVKDLTPSSTDIMWDTKPYTPSSKLSGTISTNARTYGGGAFVQDGVYYNSKTSEGANTNGLCLGYMFQNTHSILLKQLKHNDGTSCSDLGLSQASATRTSDLMFNRANNYVISDDCSSAVVHELGSRMAVLSSPSVNTPMQLLKQSFNAPIEYSCAGNTYISAYSDKWDLFTASNQVSGDSLRIEPVIQNYYPQKYSGRIEFGLPTVVSSSNELACNQRAWVQREGAAATELDCDGYVKYKKPVNSESWSIHELILIPQRSGATDNYIIRAAIKRLEISCDFNSPSTSKAMLGILKGPTLPGLQGQKTEFEKNEDFLFSIYPPSSNDDYYAENRDMSDENKLANATRFTGERYGIQIDYVSSSHSLVRYFVDSKGVRTYYTPNRNSGKLTDAFFSIGYSIYSYGSALINPRMSIIYN